MKKLYTLFTLFLSLLALAQAPQGFNYQATIRNSSGQLLLNQIVSVKFNVLQNSSTGTIVYSETQTTTSDDLGQISLIVGQGTPTTGTFSAINWGSGNYYMGIELNTGNGYVAMGTTQLLSVPYALYANSSGNSQTTTPNLADVLAVNNSAKNTKISNLADPTEAQDAVTNHFLASQIANLQAQITALQNASPLTSIVIGTQAWENTNYDKTTYRDGTQIPQVNDPTQWCNLRTGAWCYYNNDPANGAVYGKLYNWYAIVGIYDTASLSDPSLRKQFAPQGWHVPVDSEWTTLTNYLGGLSVAGGALKETGIAHWASPNTSATNSSGFSGLPGGELHTCGGEFDSIGNYGIWWSSTELAIAPNPIWYPGTALFRYLNNSSVVGRDSQGQTYGMSVRLLRD
jgi:uncharacterized protein (TIGR02145 family)